MLNEDSKWNILMYYYYGLILECILGREIGSQRSSWAVLQNTLIMQVTYKGTWRLLELGISRLTHPVQARPLDIPLVRVIISHPTIYTIKKENINQESLFISEINKTRTSETMINCF